MKTLKHPYTQEQYAEAANYANQRGLVFKKLDNGDIELVNLEPTPVPPVSQTVLDLRDKYKASTRSICELAGHAVRDKLEDVEYEQVLISAMSNNPIQASMLSQTTMYCLMQLYRLDGSSAWERI